ncbi:hypothetical protein SCALM49S_02376 [Streptomyces californicus]
MGVTSKGTAQVEPPRLTRDWTASGNSFFTSSPEVGVRFSRLPSLAYSGRAE